MKTILKVLAVVLLAMSINFAETAVTEAKPAKNYQISVRVGPRYHRRPYYRSRYARWHRRAMWRRHHRMMMRRY